MLPKIFRLFWAFLLFLALFGCVLQPVMLPTPSVPPTAILTPTGASTRTIHTDLPATATASPTNTIVIPTATPAPTISAVPYEVRIHPDGELYSGDLVSFEVIAPVQADVQGVKVQIEVAGSTLGPIGFDRFGIAGRLQATFTWAWDTTGLLEGNYTLTFSLLPGESWTQIIHLQPRGQLDPGEAATQWASARSACCTLYYMTNTAAERDLPDLLVQTDLQARDAIQRMGIEFTDPITVTLLPRVLGHGGFASDEIHISYLDRNYAANNFSVVLHHEMIHILDARLGGDFHPSLFQEGLAVYQTGGHFKSEPLLPRAAALFNLGDYIPLKELADNFYPSQHEIGYLEGAALIAYMTQRWGYPAFDQLYRDIELPPNSTSAQAIDSALQKHFSLGLAVLEKDFLTFLRRQTFTPDQRDDLRLTIAYFDTVRRYQKLLDPSAYFDAAWILDTKEMRRRGSVADYVRHPTAPNNFAVETMLVTANQHLQSSQYDATGVILREVNLVLDAIEAGAADPFAVSFLASDYLGIVEAMQVEGYEPQKVDVNGDTASAWGSLYSPTLYSLKLDRTINGWELVKNTGRMLPSHSPGIMLILIFSGLVGEGSVVAAKVRTRGCFPPSPGIDKYLHQPRIMSDPDRHTGLMP